VCFSSSTPLSLDVDIKYFDLGLEYRDQTDDKVTIDAAEACLKWVAWTPASCVLANRSTLSGTASVSSVPLLPPTRRASRSSSWFVLGRPP
jgi:hypothetical protein